MTDAAATEPGGPPTPRSSLRLRQVPKLGASVVVLAASSYVANHGVPAWEVNLFEKIHNVPRAVDYALWLPMQAGSAFAPAVVAFVAWWITRSWRPTVGSLVTGWGGWWLAKGVKDAIQRGRPSEVLADHMVRSTAVTEGLGFVSGHATVAFACAATLSPYVTRGWRTFGYGLATAVGLSRVVVGAHFPLDVVGGAALGLTLAYTWHLAVGIDLGARQRSASER
ncbi:MAG: phosphatase PAP2 family protein [Actinomycetes bacterium]